MERFAAFLGKRPPDAADRDDVEAFIASLGRKPRTEAWQIRQATDAVRIPITYVFGKSRFDMLRTLRFSAAEPARLYLAGGFK